MMRLCEAKLLIFQLKSVLDQALIRSFREKKNKNESLIL